MAKNDFLRQLQQNREAERARVAKEAAERIMWLAVVALNNVFGFGEQRAQRFMDELVKLANEHNAECGEDYDTALEHLRRRLETILKSKVERVD